MSFSGPCTAFLGLPGYGEWILLLVVGLLLFGRRLPEVGRQLGKTVVNFRRGLADFKHQINSDESVREARESVAEIKRAVDVPRIATDPKRMVKKFADDVMASPIPEDRPQEDSSDEPEHKD